MARKKESMPYVTKKGPMTGYKAISSDWTGLNKFKYEVGETYEEDVEPIPYKQGFHFGETWKDVFRYSCMTPKAHYVEVEALGKIAYSEGICTTNKIRIVREIPLSKVLAEKSVNFGLHNWGINNLGDHNNGSYNSGIRNIGDGNSGSYNIGNHNTGNMNRGNANTGSNNIGSENSGSYNVGDSNTGWWNMADGCSGYFNTVNNSNGWFNHPKDHCHTTLSALPAFLLDVNRMEWVPFFQLDKRSKEARKASTKMVVGVLQEAKNCMRHALLNAQSQDNWNYQLRQLLSLPHFDIDVFTVITGLTMRDLKGA